MNILTTPEACAQFRKTLQVGSIGFVPTMGNLHEGHLHLMRRAKAENDLCVASLFINPTQFNSQADLDRYPKTFEQDCALLESIGVDTLFAPQKEDMYPDGFEVQVSETVESQLLEGVFRPGHFTGILTVVLKLFNLIRPTRAYFGEKDFQQLRLVQKMVKALFLPIEMVPCPTIRSEEGLALSSRNGRLSHDGKIHAAHLSATLRSAKTPEAAFQELERLGFKPEYVEDRWGRRLAAAWLEEVRLIDNVDLGERAY